MENDSVIGTGTGKKRTRSETGKKRTRSEARNKEGKMRTQSATGKLRTRSEAVNKEGKKRPRSEESPVTGMKRLRSEESPSDGGMGNKSPRSEKPPSGGGMEKEWPPLKDCPQYRMGLINLYMDKDEWEKRLTSNQPQYYCCTYNGTYEYRFDPTQARKFLEIMRNTRGYDLDEEPPAYYFNTLMPLDSEEIIEYKTNMDISKKLFVQHINSKTRKVYIYVETLKAAVSLPHRVLLLTFTAKEDADDAPVETFLATVSITGSFEAGYKVLECIIKPDGPAPTQL